MSKPLAHSKNKEFYLQNKLKSMIIIIVFQVPIAVIMEHTEMKDDEKEPLPFAF